MQVNYDSMMDVRTAPRWRQGLARGRPAEDLAPHRRDAGGRLGHRAAQGVRGLHHHAARQKRSLLERRGAISSWISISFQAKSAIFVHFPPVFPMFCCEFGRCSMRCPSSTRNRNVRRIFAPGALYKAALMEDLKDLQELLEEFPEADARHIDEYMSTISLYTMDICEALHVCYTGSCRRY